MIVSERKARSTGTVVDVIDNRDHLFDSADLPWITLCADHGSYCSHETRKLATYFASSPEVWCEDCRRQTSRCPDCGCRSEHVMKARIVPYCLKCQRNCRNAIT